MKEKHKKKEKKHKGHEMMAEKEKMAHKKDHKK
jgi:hypothetical protein